MDACTDDFFIGVVKIIAFPCGSYALRAGGFNLKKNEPFSKVSHGPHSFICSYSEIFGSLQQDIQELS